MVPVCDQISDCNPGLRGALHSGQSVQALRRKGLLPPTVSDLLLTRNILERAAQHLLLGALEASPEAGRLCSAADWATAAAETGICPDWRQLTACKKWSLMLDCFAREEEPSSGF